MVFSELMAAGQAGDADAQFKLGSGYYYGNEIGRASCRERV